MRRFALASRAYRAVDSRRICVHAMQRGAFDFKRGPSGLLRRGPSRFLRRGPSTRKLHVYKPSFGLSSRNLNKTLTQGIGEAKLNLRPKDVMVSYCRRNKPFVERLVKALEDNDVSCWVDWKDIPHGVDWMKSIQSGILNCNTFVFCLSPESIKSKVCGEEVSYALRCGKRVVPIVVKDGFAWDDVQPEVAKINFIFFNGEDNPFEERLSQLLECISLNYDHLVAHTELQRQSMLWVRMKKRPELLLRGVALTDASSWLLRAQKENFSPQPTDVQCKYLMASHVMEARQKCNRGLLRALLRGEVSSPGESKESKREPSRLDFAANRDFHVRRCRDTLVARLETTAWRWLTSSLCILTILIPVIAVVFFDGSGDGSQRSALVAAGLVVAALSAVELALRWAGAELERASEWGALALDSVVVLAFLYMCAANITGGWSPSTARILLLLGQLRYARLASVGHYEMRGEADAYVALMVGKTTENVVLRSRLAKISAAEARVRRCDGVQGQLRRHVAAETFSGLLDAQISKQSVAEDRHSPFQVHFHGVGAWQRGFYVLRSATPYRPAQLSSWSSQANAVTQSGEPQSVLAVSEISAVISRQLGEFDIVLGAGGPSNSRRFRAPSAKKRNKWIRKLRGMISRTQCSRSKSAVASSNGSDTSGGQVAAFSRDSKRRSASSSARSVISKQQSRVPEDLKHLQKRRLSDMKIEETIEVIRTMQEARCEPGIPTPIPNPTTLGDMFDAPSPSFVREIAGSAQPTALGATADRVDAKRKSVVGLEKTASVVGKTSPVEPDST